MNLATVVVVVLYSACLPESKVETLQWVKERRR